MITISYLKLTEIIDDLLLWREGHYIIIFVIWSWTYRLGNLNGDSLSTLTFYLLLGSFSIFKPNSTEMFVTFVIMVICIIRIYLDWRDSFGSYFILFCMICCQSHINWCVCLEILNLTSSIHSIETFISNNLFIQLRFLNHHSR